MPSMSSSGVVQSLQKLPHPWGTPSSFHEFDPSSYPWTAPESHSVVDPRLNMNVLFQTMQSEVEYSPMPYPWFSDKRFHDTKQPLDHMTASPSPALSMIMLWLISEPVES